MSFSQLEQVFHENIEHNFQINMLHELNEAYEEAADYCRPPKYGLNEAADLRGHLIRASFETKFRKLASEYSGIKAESRLNSQKSYHHTVVKAGQLFLTASSVNKKGDKPRYAEFRNEYATNGQLHLFEDASCVDEEVYAIFRYGPLKAQTPSIATISFLNKEGSGFIENIDLIALHPGIIQAPKHDVVEVQEEPIPKIICSPEEIIQQPRTLGLRLPRITRKEGS